MLQQPLSQNPLHNLGTPQDLLRTLEGSPQGPSQDVHKTLLGLLQGPLRPPQDLLRVPQNLFRTLIMMSSGPFHMNPQLS